MTFVDTLYILDLEVNQMYATIQKWGNSHAIRLPKGILEAVNLRENDRVEIDIDKDIIIIRRANKKHIRLEDRIAEYTEEYRSGEWDTGGKKGKEVW